MMLLSQGNYLGIAIATLAGLGILAIVLFLLLRKGGKMPRRKCQGCGDTTCPIAISMASKEDEEQ